MEGRGGVILSIIVAMDGTGVIGNQGKLPWRVPEDMRYFRHTTMGHPVIMGRKTFEGLAAPLAGRRMVVMTRAHRLPAAVESAGSVEQALGLVSTSHEAFIAGGAQIYALFLPLARRLYVTLVPGEHRGDARFPPLDWGQWTLLRERKGEGSGETACLYRLYERRGGPR